MSTKFVWRGLQKQIGYWTKQCLACQTSKVQSHIKAPLQKFDNPLRRFDHIHVDLVGPLPPSNGYTHLFTVIDRFTRWPETIPLNSTTAIDCAQALLTHWISRFGIPLHISSDRGPQFTSQLWMSVAKLLGTQVHHTTAYHPQANGLVERFHRHLKSALRARLTGPNWINELPWVLPGIRTTPKEDFEQPTQKHLATQPPSPTPQPIITRSGRQIKPNRRYMHSVLGGSGVAESASQD